jgi:hypothetical protein
MKILKAIPLLLIAAMLSSASGVRARTLHGAVMTADDNGNCKDKGLHKGNQKGRCGPTCLEACDIAAADGAAVCLNDYNYGISITGGDPELIAQVEAIKTACDATVLANQQQCVASCPQ